MEPVRFLHVHLNDKDNFFFVFRYHFGLGRSKIVSYIKKKSWKKNVQVLFYKFGEFNEALFCTLAFEINQLWISTW